MSTVTHLRAYATVTGASARFVAPDGSVDHLDAARAADIRGAVLRRAADEARATGAAIELVTTGDRGEHRLLVDGDGDLRSLDLPVPEMDAAPTPSAVEASRPVPAITTPVPLSDSAPQERTSFIDTVEPSAAGYNPDGWRGLLYRLGLVQGPSKAEAARIEREQTVSRQWAGCRTIAVANGKGGVGKTMTTAMLSAAYARYGGGNVLAWDNNDTRGTLGWRTEQGRYDTTIRDLLPAASDLLSPAAGISDIARYVHHQSVDRYDVLRSNPELLAAHQHIAHAEFDTLMRVAARYYRLVVFDSGNDESADRWLRMVDSSYQLVVPTLASPESAESALLLLEALRERDAHSAALAANAVVIVTLAEPTSRTTINRIVTGFEPIVRAVETIPFDPALKSGPLRYDNLRAPTRDAWLKAAASAASVL